MIAGGGYEGPGPKPGPGGRDGVGVSELMLGRKAEARVWVV